MKYKNRPPHIFLDGYYYFITSRTLKRMAFFNIDVKKKILLEVIEVANKKFIFDLVAWVILSNHYHVLIKMKNASLLTKIMNNIHANSARLLNKLENCQGRKIWWNYWDHCVRDEADYWKHFNYIHHNPVKHGFVKNMEDYQFSSYNSYIKKHGREWMDSSFEFYPISDFTPQDI